MGFRITTNMMMNTYRHNLMGSTNKLADARDMVLTQRTFNSYADDPAAAAQAFRLRRDYWSTSNQYSSNDATYNKFHVAWTNLKGIVNNLIDANGRMSAIGGVTGTAGESRIALGKVLDETADTIINAMNKKLGDQFVFAGNYGLKVHLEWKGEELYYRGINVNCGKVERPATAEPGWANPKDEFGMPENMPKEDDPTLTADQKEWIKYYKDSSDKKKLDKMCDEEMLLDLGMGMAEGTDGKLKNGSAFNSALAGIKFVGYGIDDSDEFGDPKNVAMIMKRLGQVFSQWSEDAKPQGYVPAPGTNETPESLAAEAERLMTKLKLAQESITEKYVELDANSSFLKTNGSRLQDQAVNLNEQILNVEQVDLADAITNFSWEQYCYNSALKIGNQLLSQSLIDYMR